MELLQEDENKYCADCEAKQPRWASWNIGIFLCIRCAGLHRNLGVHISKVKSVSLDTWLPEQVQSMRVMGNAKAKAVYEAELPDVFRRPQTDQALEHFIRAKYDAKRYMLKGWVPPVVDVKDLPPLNESATAKPLMKKLPLTEGGKNPALSQQRSNAQPESAKKQEVTLVDLFSTDDPTQSKESALKSSTDLFGNSQSVAALKSPLDDNLDDLFGSMVSAPSIPPTQTNSTSNTSNVDALSSGLESLDFNNTRKPMNNEDIMALYNQPASVNPNMMAMPQQQTQFHNFNRVSAQQTTPTIPTAQAGFSQQSAFASYNTPSYASSQQWPNDSMTTQPSAFGELMSIQSNQSTNQQPKQVSSTAFDDLFAAASAQFSASSTAAPKPSNPMNNHNFALFNNVSAASPNNSSNAQQDLESLFM